MGQTVSERAILMTEEIKKSVSFSPVISITKDVTGLVSIKMLNTPAEGENSASSMEIVSMCLQAAFQVSNDAVGSMQELIKVYEGTISDLQEKEEDDEPA